MTVIFVGLIAVFASVYLLVSSSVNGIKRKKEEYCAVVALLLYIRGALSSEGGRLCDMVRKFSSEPLEENGLLAVLRSDSVGNSRDSNEPEERLAAGGFSSIWVFLLVGVALPQGAFTAF